MLPVLIRRIARAARAYMRILPASERGLLVHLTTHGPELTSFLGPLSGFHMFPFESFFGYIKRFVQNKSHPEANIMMCYRIVVFGHVLNARYPDALRISSCLVRVPEEDSESDESDTEEEFVPRFQERVVAPMRGQCQRRKQLCRDEQQALYVLLGHHVQHYCRLVKSGSR